MRRSNSNFGGYRGRRTLTDILRIIAISLGVVVALVVAVLFFAQDYIVYTDDGMRLELPFLKQNQTDSGQKGLDPGSVTVVEQEGGTSAQGQSDGENPPMRAVQLSVDSVVDDTAPALLAEAGANTLVLEMKGQDGILSWQSEVELPQWAGINGTAAVNEAMEKFKSQDVYTVARVCCFRDDSMPYFDTSLALRSSGGHWRDELGLRWLSPASSRAQEYLASLCGELAEMGFDEILLEEYTFPVDGDLGYIVTGAAYDPNQFTQQVQSFLTQVKQALAPYGTRLSLRVSGELLAENGNTSGLNKQLLQDFADSIWVENPTDLTTLLDQPEMKDIGLVRIVNAWSGDENLPQAILSAEKVE